MFYNDNLFKKIEWNNLFSKIVIKMKLAKNVIIF